MLQICLAVSTRDWKSLACNLQQQLSAMTAHQSSSLLLLCAELADFLHAQDHENNDEHKGQEVGRGWGPKSCKAAGFEWAAKSGACCVEK